MLHFNTWLSSMGSLQCLSKRDQEGISLSHMASLSGKEKAQFFCRRSIHTANTFFFTPSTRRAIQARKAVIAKALATQEQFVICFVSPGWWHSISTILYLMTKCYLCLPPLHTTLQSMMNAKLCRQCFWPSPPWERGHLDNSNNTPLPICEFQGVDKDNPG